MKKEVAGKVAKAAAVKLKLGDTVEWISQANGYIKKKVGKIVGVIPAGGYYGDTYEKIKKKLPEHNDAFGYGGSRDHKSYLILVSVNPSNKKPTIYWPLVKNLRKVEE
jgi:hypothetical protein